ncbi:molybdenum cofactor synthesis protein 2 small subunit [Dictyostelium discoideum AX4]|uniref:Molybdopterin synthase sulfur carrier subunit n=1 Tax=Dictyostelium discoideum TaxID=44689 RepID=MOC2A_DICDI|nr:molybdenum cofactor synthesis protein 2 small subunit [Dictyostelium discoideum AX4]Q54NM8.1 RecName: Full=Molybdopterin synthase sulfur carrier subunit; AltName: Full=Molybdenum cofactor synthesis protein 2 small subunit; AltName: Full=Molybdenum cofactor synthesis protein 2A; Short=MOCS2A; AltName: Full=Sulfur carrier protein MOCS2A [Dictyostelium discoideum]EAL64879.1 molybdenum cofactor synthesis protein 2 small subunit [Dictyostelium discoideum AX4]|eukprot:XP_639888.1 molybdenum cofactor synthesis protein 2 small subunit [Dictyostelium discoideum AX4]
MSNQFKILLFAKVKEVIGKDSIFIDLPLDESTSFNLIRKLKHIYPQISSTLEVSLLAVNQEYISRDQDIKINSNDEIAIIPPVSGG